MWTNIQAWIKKMTDKQHKLIMWIVVLMWIWSLVFGDASAQTEATKVFMGSFAVFGFTGGAVKAFKNRNGSSENS